MGHSRSSFVLACLLCLGALIFASAGSAQTLVAATGDSNIDGKNVSRSEAYPAKLEQWLRSKGYNVQVTNTGISGDTTDGLLARLDSAVPQGARVAVICIGTDDRKRGHYDPARSQANVDEIASRLRARGITVFMFNRTGKGAIPLGRFQAGLKGQPEYSVDGEHLNPAGFDIVVARTAPKIAAALRR